MPKQDDLLARFGREPLNLALEHIERWPRKSGAADENKLRQRTFVMSALGKKAGAMDGEFVWNTFTCGYFKRADGLAVIPIWGDLGPMRSFWSWVYYEDLAETAHAAAKDGDVKAVLYHFDSPGGYVVGNAECAAAIAEAAKLKPSAAYANDYCTSAAYWLASATGRITAPPTGVVASIGALCIHDEVSRALDDAGITVSVIRSGPRKAETNPFEPLSPAARQQLQSEIAVCGDEFVKAVATLRGIDVVAVQGTQAACMTTEAAVAAKLADGIETFDQACAALLARATPVIAPPAAAPVAKPRNPARGQTAKPTPSARASAQPRSTTMKKRADDSAATPAATDPTSLPPEEQIARYDEIVALVAETPADDHGKIGQFVQICAIVNGAADASTEPADDPADDSADPASAQAIANSPEGKANPQAAVAAIAAGLSLRQFKAMAPNMAKGAAGGGLRARMGNNTSSQSLGGGGGNDDKGGESKVVEMPTSASIFGARRAQVSGKK